MSNITASEMQAPPAVPTRPLRDLSALALMLADGWRIEAPVLARLSWAQRRTGELAYHVIVTRAAQQLQTTTGRGSDFGRLSAHADDARQCRAVEWHGGAACQQQHGRRESSRERNRCRRIAHGDVHH